MTRAVDNSFTDFLNLTYRLQAHTKHADHRFYPH